MLNLLRSPLSLSHSDGRGLYVRWFVLLLLHLPSFLNLPRSSPGTGEIFVRIKAPGINIPRSREGGDGGRGAGWTKRGMRVRGVRACLPYSRNNGSITIPLPPTPSPPHLLKLSPLSGRLLLALLEPLFLPFFPSLFPTPLSPVFPSSSTLLPRHGSSPVSFTRLRFPRPLLSYTRRRSPS